jgi:hypothetical protein
MKTPLPDFLQPVVGYGWSEATQSYELNPRERRESMRGMSCWWNMGKKTTNQNKNENTPTDN